MKKKDSFRILLCFVFLSFANAAFAWSWQLGIINNLDVSLNYKFNQKNAGNAVAEDGTKNEGVIKSNDSTTFVLTTGGTFNKTTDGVLSIWNSLGLNCNLRYYQESIYSAHNLGTWRLDGNGNSAQCAELFLSSTEASDDGWDPTKLIFNAIQFPRLTKGQTQCSGIDNCVVVNPPQYTTQWAVKNINRQTHIADFEKLNVGQIVGTHNSLISRFYTTGEFMTNMNYADPNHYINVTDQLNLGIRQLEFDFLEDNGELKLCHYKSEDSALDVVAQLFICHGNRLLAVPLLEINTWLSTHPDELIYIYFDNVEPWNPSRLEKFNQLLRNTFGEKILTKNDVLSSSLPVHELTRDEIVHKFKRNIIFYAHNLDPIFSSSLFVFFKATGSDSNRLHDDRNIANFYNIKQSCDEDKTCLVSALYPNNRAHLNLYTIREDRTYLTQKKGSQQDTSVYLTNAKLKDAIRYPINIFDFDKLSLNDSRLYTAVWSFAYPYPLQAQEGGADYAYIDGVSKKFSNKILTNSTLDALCYNTGQNKWFLVSNVTADSSALPLETLLQTAKNLCAQFENSLFVTPVSGYQLDEIVKSGIIQNPTLINYTRNLDGMWIPNDKFPIYPSEMKL